jgi:hypothetical protein
MCRFAPTGKTRNSAPIGARVDRNAWSGPAATHGRVDRNTQLLHPFLSAGLSRRTTISIGITGDQVPEHRC